MLRSGSCFTGKRDSFLVKKPNVCNKDRGWVLGILGEVGNPLFLDRELGGGLCAKLLQSCLILCDPVDCSPAGSSVHRILQTIILEWVAMISSRESSRPRDQKCVSYISCIDRQFFTTSAT